MKKSHLLANRRNLWRAANTGAASLKYVKNEKTKRNFKSRHELKSEESFLQSTTQKSASAAQTILRRKCTK
jgi:hypothetical protein